MARRVLTVACVLVFAFANAPSVLAAGYTAPCSTYGDSSSHLDRSNYANYTAVQGTVVVAQVLSVCTGGSGSGPQSSMVFPANIATSSRLVQLGYGRLGNAAPGFLYTPSDNSSPLGVVTYLSSPNMPFTWGHSYTFTIEWWEYNNGISIFPQWRMTIEDKTANKSLITSITRHLSGHATQVWYQLEAYDPGSVFGASSGNTVSITPMKYKYNNNTAWTTLTGDTSVNWGCVGCVAPPSWWHSIAVSPAGQGHVSVLQGWTTSH